jgi:hypothetical protein
METQYEKGKHNIKFISFFCIFRTCYFERFYVITVLKNSFKFEIPVIMRYSVYSTKFFFMNVERERERERIYQQIQLGKCPADIVNSWL